MAQRTMIHPEKKNSWVPVTVRIGTRMRQPDAQKMFNII
jgi:hypothetical protein